MFVKLSSRLLSGSKILIDSPFVTDYMPYAPEMCVKVYLLGLTLAYSGADNSVDMIAKTLGIKTDDVLAAFKYWEDQGIISMLSVSPPMVEFCEVVSSNKRIRTFSKTKYKAFNDQLHALFPSRSILPAEYHEYYNAIESYHIEAEGMLAIIAYCIRLKGDSIGYPYILTVARNLAAEGYTTFDRINERLSEYDLYDGEIKAIIKALKQKRQPDLNDKRFYIKWTKGMGFTPDTIIKAAKDVKKGGIERLDFLLARYYENHAFSYDEIVKYNEHRTRLYSLTATIVKMLGKYYDRLDYIIESYTAKWLSYGFSDSALTAVADHCFRIGVRDLEGMDSVVSEFYKQGLLSPESIGSFRDATATADEDIRKVLKHGGIERSVTTWDRDAYRTWTFTWGFSVDIIMLAAGIGRGKGTAYIGGILASWHSKGIKTIEAATDEAKKSPSPTSATPDVTSVTKKSADELAKDFGTISADEI